MPKSGEGFIDFIGQVHKTKEQFGQDGPITVHCSAGVGRSGVFISLSIVLERMQYEGVLDVFQTVRTLRSQRPAMVQTEVSIQFAQSRDGAAPIVLPAFRLSPQYIRTIQTLIYLYSLSYFQDQYQFCYRAALEYLGSFDHYAN